MNKKININIINARLIRTKHAQENSNARKYQHRLYKKI